MAATALGARPAGAISAAIAAGAMVATPLASRGGGARRVLSTTVVTGIAGSTLAASVRRWGGRRAALAAASVAASTLAVEHVGSRSGTPFGRYRYTGALRPEIAGVPAVVPLAWYAMAVPAREAAHAVLGRRSTPVRRAALGAAALTAWDLFLDPQMVSEGYWRWDRAGRYRGIPLSNFAGWLLTSLGVMALLEATVPEAEPAGAQPDGVLVGTYGFMAVMETLGFAAFFRDRTVAAVGGAAMLPLAAAAALRTIRRG